jgi:hypothetical protein
MIAEGDSNEFWTVHTGDRGPARAWIRPELPG